MGDLLRWTENYDTPRVGDRAFVETLQTPGRFNDGRPHEYALGLYVREHRGLREVGHSGSTAGYRAFLARYPDQRVAVAVLCNVDRGDPEASAHRVVDMYLAQRAALGAVPARADRRVEPKTSWRPSAADRAAFAGRYYSDEIETTLTVSVESGALVLHRRPDTAMAMAPKARDAFDTDLGLVRFHRDDTGRVVDLGVTVDRVWDLRFLRQRDRP